MYPDSLNMMQTISFKKKLVAEYGETTVKSNYSHTSSLSLAWILG
jgi:hypothetical protein